MTPKDIITHRLSDFINYLESEYLLSSYKSNQFKILIGSYYKKRGMFQPQETQDNEDD